MQKSEAIKLLGGTAKKASEAMGYKSVQAIYMWPEVLPLPLSDQVIGAWHRKRSTKKRQSRPAKADLQPAI